ncbi:MAG: hypothetical protein N2C14_15525 [Planctomycetales bacterium]
MEINPYQSPKSDNKQPLFNHRVMNALRRSVHNLAICFTGCAILGFLFLETATMTSEVYNHVLTFTVACAVAAIVLRFVLPKKRN